MTSELASLVQRRVRSLLTRRGRKLALNYMATAKPSGKKRDRSLGRKRVASKKGPAPAAPYWQTSYGGLTVSADLYCRLRAGGDNQAQAYAQAYGGRSISKKPEHLRKCGGALEARPEIKERILAIRSISNECAAMAMEERRALLAQTARAEPATAPTHGNRIAAIREDAILAGERQTDTPVNISLDVAGLLAALSGGAANYPADQGPRIVEPIPTDQPARETTENEQPTAKAELMEPVSLPQALPTLDNPTQTSMVDLGD